MLPSPPGGDERGDDRHEGGDAGDLCIAEPEAERHGCGDDGGDEALDDGGGQDRLALLGSLELGQWGTSSQKKMAVMMMSTAQKTSHPIE